MLHVHNRQTRVRPLPEALEAALAAAFFSDVRGADDLVRARALLAELHRDRAWLACDCESGPDDTWPMIGPRDGRGGMHPFRFGQVTHRPGCPFAGVIRKIESPSDQDADDHGPIEGDWHLADLFPTGQSVEDRREVLSRLLRTALAQLGFERLHVSAFDPASRGKHMRMLETPFGRLRHLGGQAMGNGLTFHEVGLTFLPALPRWLNDLAARLPSATGVGGIYLGVTEMLVPPDKDGATGFLTARDVRGERRTFPMHGRAFLPAGDNGMLGPYWTLALIEAGANGRWHLGDVLVMHALDRRTLLPIPTAAHRAAAGLLLEQMQFWRSWKKLTVDVELAAPLFPSPYPVRPAFALVLPNGMRIAVDIEGSPSQADGVVILSTTNSDPEGTRRRLTAAVARAMTEVRH